MSARGRPVNIGASNHGSLSLPAAARSSAAHNVITVSRVTCYITALSPCDITSPYLRVTERVWSDKSLSLSLSATQSHYHALTVKLKTTILRLIVSTHTRSWPLGDTLCAQCTSLLKDFYVLEVNLSAGIIFFGPPSAPRRSRTFFFENSWHFSSLFCDL